MPRCGRAGDSGTVAHTGAWAFCPWCGDRLPAPRQPRAAGRCVRCGEAARGPSDCWCAPCWLRHITRSYANGHSLEELAALRAARRSWREIARAFGLTRPRKGPDDVRTAAFWLWDDAGSPGNPADWPDLPEGADWNAWLRSPELAPWQRARDAAIDRWLGDVARRRTEGAAHAP